MKIENGDMDMERWIHGDRDMERCRYGDREWRYGHREMDMEVEMWR